MAENEEFIREFLDESYENLDRLDQDFVALESAPHDAQRLASIFRTIHTIKGTSGFFGFSKLGAIAHAGETLLGKLREGELFLDQEITTALLDAVDAIREILGKIETSQSEGDGDYRAINERLTQLLSKKQQPPPNILPVAAETPLGELVSSMALTEAAISLNPLPLLESEKEQIAVIASQPPQHDPSASGHQHQFAPVQIETETLGAGVPGPSEPPTASLNSVANGAGPPHEGSVRVDVGLLNRLMNLVGELVLARNQLLQVSRTLEDRSFTNVTQRLNVITTELQEDVMKTRMQPIAGIWGKFPRVVRDLAVACRKEVHLEMEGNDTELDRTLLEAIKDPLTHLIRNAVDHGIETPEVRLAKGKPRCGRLLLKAYHEGGQVNVEIMDDGSGIQVDKVKRKALENGLVAPEDLAVMRESDLVQLIFHPGFSTADKVTDISGRGVGMDVVKTNIEQIGGAIEVQNRLGFGTTIRVKIPLTLAIVPALVVTCAQHRFAIPRASLVELLNLEGQRIFQDLEYIDNTPVLRLRGQVLPLLDLREVVQAKPPTELLSQNSVSIVVLHVGKRPFGLIVDSINNSEEVVVKPLHPFFNSSPIFSGATIMGDGSLALILDVSGLARYSGISTNATVQHELQPPTANLSLRETEKSFLLCSMSSDKQVAVPLIQVDRLEEFAADRIEWSADREVVQYRGKIMPLVRIAASQDGGIDHLQTVKVIVASVGHQHFGIIVRDIVDVVYQTDPVDARSKKAGLLGTTIINCCVTDVLDLPGILRSFSVLQDSN